MLMLKFHPLISKDLRSGTITAGIFRQVDQIGYNFKKEERQMQIVFCTKAVPAKVRKALVKQLNDKQLEAEIKNFWQEGIDRYNKKYPESPLRG